jgi:hypothetical protein
MDCVLFLKDIHQFSSQYENIIEYDEKKTKKGIQNFVPIIFRREVEMNLTSSKVSQNELNLATITNISFKMDRYFIFVSYLFKFNGRNYC